MQFKIEKNISYEEYWDCSKRLFPQLYYMSRKYKSMSASEISVERLFSICENINSNKRNRMKLDRLGKFASLKYNLTKRTEVQFDKFYEDLKQYLISKFTLFMPSE